MGSITDILKEFGGKANLYDIRRAQTQSLIVEDLYFLLYPHILNDFTHLQDFTAVINGLMVTPADHIHTIIKTIPVNRYNNLTNPSTTSLSTGQLAKINRKPSSVDLELGLNL